MIQKPLIDDAFIPCPLCGVPLKNGNDLYWHFRGLRRGRCSVPGSGYSFWDFKAHKFCCLCGKVQFDEATLVECLWRHARDGTLADILAVNLIGGEL